jgi:hypothetical protein
MITRSSDQSNGRHMVHKYGSSTSTGTLQKHLYTYHIQDWISECERLQIRITAKDALAAIATFQGTQGQTQTQQRLKFTQERFINALAEFIVAKDQVFLIFLLIFLFIILILTTLAY